MSEVTNESRRTLAREFELTPAQARAVLGATRAVAEADGPARERGAELLATLAATLELGDDWRAVPAATAAAVGEAFPSATARRALVDALLIPACIDGEVTAAGEATTRAFARALDVRSPWLRALAAIRRGRVLALKRELYPRSPDARRLFARTWAEEGFGGLWRALLFMLGRFVDPPLAARFRALGELPRGSLGRTFHDDIVARGLAFPGEPRGLPEKMIHHDLMHVINGYPPVPAGECELAGFYAAFCPGDSFTFIVTALTTFHLGLPVSPPMVTPTRGAFDPARVLAAFLRGRRLRLDVMGPWDYWSLMPLTIAGAREQLGIADAPPRPALDAV
jgi:hypothetical protein